MTLDLSSACQKLYRALLHLNELGDHMQALAQVGDRNWTLPIEERYQDPQGVRHLFRVGTLVMPRLEASTALGDYIQNLRAALDHLAWEMVLRGGTPEATENKAASGIQFPVYSRMWAPRDVRDRKLTFRGQVERCLPGVPPPQRTLVRRYQPYHRGQWKLGALATLSNNDKHRVITPVALVTSQITRKWFRANRGPIHRWAPLVGPNIRVNERTPFLEAVVDPDADVIMETNLGSKVAFRERRGRYHQVPALREIGETVAEILSEAATRWGTPDAASAASAWLSLARQALSTGLRLAPDRVNSLVQAIERDLGPSLIDKSTARPRA